MAGQRWAIALLSTCLACRSTGVAEVTGVPAVSAGPSVQLSGGPSDYLLDFGPVAIGTEVTASISLENIGAAPMTVTQLTPPTDGAFTLDLGGSVTLPGSGQVPLTVSYKPAEAGTHSFVVPLQTDSTKVPVLTVTLTGDGEKRALTVTPEQLDFGNVVVHTTASMSLNVVNASAFALTVSPSALSGATPTVFSLTPANAFMLAAGQAQQITVTYAPLAPSPADSAQLSLGASIGPPLAVSLKGVALQGQLLISPPSLDFGFVQRGDRPSKTVRITNASTSSAQVVSIGISPLGDVDAFSIPRGLPTGARTAQTLAPGASLDVPVSFGPLNQRPYQGGLVIETTADQEAQVTVPLSGFGGGAAISCEPGRIDFGEVAAGFTTTLTLLCTNSGSDVPGHPEAGLILAGLPTSSTLFGAGVDARSPGQPIPAGSSVLIDVSYEPATASIDTGTLTVLSNAPSPAPVIPLAGSATSEGPCNFSLTPTSLNWGQVPTLIPAVLGFTVTNLGPSECLLWQLDLAEGSDPSFSLPHGQVLSQRLAPPGASSGLPNSVTVPVQFESRLPGSYVSQVAFNISDPQSPVQLLPLAAMVANGCVSIEPPTLLFGDVGLSQGHYCQTEGRTFVVTNGCGTDVNLTGVQTTGPFAFAGVGTLPIRITPGQSSPPLEVTFRPTASGSFYGMSSVTTDQTVAPVSVFLSGNAVDSTQETDSFVVQPPKVDVLWVMDNDDDQVVVDDPTLASFFQGAGNVDYHAAVVSTEIECGGQGQLEPCATCDNRGTNATVITSADPTPDQTLSSLMSGTLSSPSWCAIVGDGDEQMLDAIYIALQPNLLAGHNNGFLRDDARLEIVVVNWDPEDDSGFLLPDQYINFLNSLKAVPSMVTVNYIDGTPQNDIARMNQVVQGTGGLLLNQWDDDTTLEASLAQLWIGAATPPPFPLGGTPAPGTLVVYLGGPPAGPGVTQPGVVVAPRNPDGTTNWTYDATANALLLNEAFLGVANDSTPLYVTYTLACG